MDDWTAAALVVLFVAGILGTFGEVLQVMTLATAMTSLTARYLAVLRDATKKEIEPIQRLVSYRGSS